MSANLNFKDGKASFFSVKEKAWHNLGIVRTDYPTIDEAIIDSGLGYQVGKLPNIHRIGELDIVSKKSFFTYRKDTNQVLGSNVGSDYTVVQNMEAFKFFDALVSEKKDLKIETAGALGNGEVIFVTVVLPDYVQVGRDDIMEQYLFFTNSHDGSMAVTVGYTNVRIVCNNTLNAALGSCTNKVKIYHTPNYEMQVKEAQKVLGLINVVPQLYEEVFNRMAKKVILDSEVKKLVAAAMCPSPEVAKKLNKDEWEELSTRFSNTINGVMEYYHTAPSQQLETTKGTLFGAYNAITGFYQNVKPFSNNSLKNPDSEKLKSILFGTAARHSQKALDLCLAEL